MPLVEANELIKNFGTFRAVDHVSLAVERGEVVGFLGPNGAGKSTTMKMITGFLEPDSGTASICGYDIASSAIEAKRRLGYLPEGAPAYGDMSVADFLKFIGKMRGLNGRRLEGRLAEMIERVNIADMWNRRIETLSKGYKRRVGIAQALIHDPDVLILDEPTDGLDPNQKHEMRELIRSIAPNKAIVISTHILEEVEAVCNRTVIIAAGKVVADETPEQLVLRETASDKIHIRLEDDDQEELLPRLHALFGDGKVEVLDQMNGSTSVIVSGNDKLSVPTEFAEALAAADMKVNEIGYYRPSLEDVFRKITAKAAD